MSLGSTLHEATPEIHHAVSREWIRGVSMEGLGRRAIRFGLVLVLIWIGAMKFTSYEAEAISGFVSNSPLMSWAYSAFNGRSFSAILGVVEIAIAILILARPISARAALVGSALATSMFLTTLSFMLSTPGVWEGSSGGFPALSVVPGQFLVKDFVLLGASLWTCGEAWNAIHDSAENKDGAKQSSLVRSTN